MILTDSENKMYIVELTVLHESNVDRNKKRKADKCSHLLKDQRLLRTYKKVEFINLVITTDGVFSKDTKPFFTILNSLQANIVEYVVQPRTQGLFINNPGTGRKVLNSDWPIKNS